MKFFVLENAFENFVTWGFGLSIFIMDLILIKLYR